MAEKINGISVVFSVLVDNESVLLLRRRDTGYMDGFYDFPSGHLKSPNEPLPEAATRELREESGITAYSENLELFYMYQNTNPEGQLYFGYMYNVAKWSGKPRIMEPHKCDDIGFFDLKNPPKVTKQVKDALGYLTAEKMVYRYFQQGVLN